MRDVDAIEDRNDSAVAKNSSTCDIAHASKVSTQAPRQHLLLAHDLVYDERHAIACSVQDDDLNEIRMILLILMNDLECVGETDQRQCAVGVSDPFLIGHPTPKRSSRAESAGRHSALAIARSDRTRCRE